MTWFITLACFACFAYGSLLQGSPAGKATPILLLAYGSVMRTPKTPPSAAYAFLFSAFGDMLLAMDDKKPGGDGSAFFLCGLVSFAIAHVCFGVAFLSKGARQGAARPELLTWHAIPFIMYAGVMYMTLLPGLVKDGPFMVVAAGVYTGLIAGMGTAAFSRFRSAKCADGVSRAAALGGAALFALSDTLLALDKWVEPLPADRRFILVMGTYYAAQLSIATAFARDYERQAERFTKQD